MSDHHPHWVRRMTIGYLMAGTSVCLLATVPVVLAWQSPDPNLMIAAVAFDFIMLPVIVALMVLHFISPGQPRNWVIAGLCSTPILVSIAGSIAMYPIMMGWEAFHPVSWASVLRLLIALQFVALLYNGVSSYIRCRCPSCGGRRFDIEYQYDPVKLASLPTGLHFCRNCHQRIQYLFMGFGRSRVVSADPEIEVKLPQGQTFHS